MPAVEGVSGRRCHIFRCNAQTCKQKTQEVKRYLDTNDAKSTSNLRKHAKRCWGDDIIATVDKAKNAKEVRATTVSGALDPESIMAAFERTGKGKVTYSHRQHTKAECQDCATGVLRARGLRSVEPGEPQGARGETT